MVAEEEGPVAELLSFSASLAPLLLALIRRATFSSSSAFLKPSEYADEVDAVDEAVVVVVVTVSLLFSQHPGDMLLMSENGSSGSCHTCNMFK